MPLDWRTAYLRQARADYAMFRLLLQSGEEIALCQKLHYLQMTTEKLAKGFLTPPNGPQYPKTHDAFVRFVRIARGRPEIRQACRFQQASQYFAYIDSLEPIAAAIESLSPEGDDHPNPEYPWIAGSQVYSPLDHTFPDLRLANPRMIKMLEFIEACFSIA